jgi:glucan phosphoethanolaminetransferase (alkaline phosphatase superfamily)
MKIIRNFFPSPKFSPISLTIVSAMAAFLYVFMEWLFIITKPSFLDLTSFGEKVLIFLSAASILAALCLLFFLLNFLANLFALPKKLQLFFQYFFAIIPTLILTALVLILVDNFTYTVFKFGIVTTSGAFRAIYTVGFFVVGVLLYKKVLQFTNSIHEKYFKTSKVADELVLGILAIFLSIWVYIPISQNSHANTGVSTDLHQSKVEKLPNIILITADSLNAERMSIYGYTKDTTPFLKELADTSLVAENAFSNAQGTIGSTTSILTGKYPADIRILHSIDILQGNDTFQHLPAILRSNGYYTAQLSYSYYADASRVNFQNAFDYANGTSIENNPFFAGIAAVLPSNYYYFIHEFTVRLSDRLGHIFFIRDMTNPYKKVTEGTEKFNDVQKLDYAISLLKTTEQPLFVHIHWLGTHGPKYAPARQVFSAGMDPTTQVKYDDNFYSDTILEFDTAVSNFYQTLEADGFLDNTIIVIASDHSQKWSVSRLPLIIHFPDSLNAKVITTNAQNLDIAPTLLDYLNINQPEWMSGQSLLTELNPMRPIFIAAIPSSKKDPVTGKVTFPESKAPFYQFGKMTVVICDTWYRLNLTEMKMDKGTVKNYVGSCESGRGSEAEALQLISQHFEKYGFDISTLQNIPLNE